MGILEILNSKIGILEFFDSKMVFLEMFDPEMGFWDFRISWSENNGNFRYFDSKMGIFGNYSMKNNVKIDNFNKFQKISVIYWILLND